ncbi:MAG: hypothetical protein AAF944_21390 [Bacteroidota bacterium]
MSDNENQEKWIEDVLGSMNKSERARPKPDLFTKIEQQLDKEGAIAVPILWRRVAAAAAVLLLMLNGLAIQQFSQSNELVPGEVTLEDTYQQSLISDYKIYD